MTDINALIKRLHWLEGVRTSWNSHGIFARDASTDEERFFEAAELECIAIAANEALPALKAAQDRIEALEEALGEVLKAIDAGSIDSAEIDLNDPDIPPFRWHEEWAHRVRQALKGEG